MVGSGARTPSRMCALATAVQCLLRDGDFGSSTAFGAHAGILADFVHFDEAYHRWREEASVKVIRVVLGIFWSLTIWCRDCHQVPR